MVNTSFDEELDSVLEMAAKDSDKRVVGKRGPVYDDLDPSPDFLESEHGPPGEDKGGCSKDSKGLEPFSDQFEKTLAQVSALLMDSVFGVDSSEVQTSYAHFMEGVPKLFRLDGFLRLDPKVLVERVQGIQAFSDGSTVEVGEIHCPDCRKILGGISIGFEEIPEYSKMRDKGIKLKDFFLQSGSD